MKILPGELVTLLLRFNCWYVTMADRNLKLANFKIQNKQKYSLSKIHWGNEKHLRNISRQARHHYSFSFQHKTHSLLLKTNIMNLKKIQGKMKTFIEMILIGSFDILILILADHINHDGVTRAGELFACRMDCGVGFSYKFDQRPAPSRLSLTTRPWWVSSPASITVTSIS